MNDKPLDRLLNGFANSEIGPEDFTDGRFTPRIPQVVRTGKMFHGFERIDIPSARILPFQTSRQDWFAQFDAEGAITAVMECAVPGTVPLANCSIDAKTEYFEMEVGGFRRNQLDELETILTHARNFTACLTWQE